MATTEMAASDATDDQQRPLAGRHALVTGGSRGIGAACARSLAGLGATITLLARDARTLTATAQRIARETGVDVGHATADATDRAALVAALERAAEKSGPISVLVNNAGGTTSAPLQALSDDAWETTLDLNLSSAFWASRAVVPAMKKDGFGRIVNIGSTASLKGYAYVAAYCAAKHGLIGLTRSLAVELAKTGITVNAVCPGFAETDMSRETIETITKTTGRTAEEARAALVDYNPQGRLIEPQEVADMVAFLCRPSAGSITGTAMPIAGGEVT